MSGSIHSRTCRQCHGRGTFAIYRGQGRQVSFCRCFAGQELAAEAAAKVVAPLPPAEASPVDPALKAALLAAFWEVHRARGGL